MTISTAVSRLWTIVHYEPPGERVKPSKNVRQASAETKAGWNGKSRGGQLPFATSDVTFRRQTHADIEALVRSTEGAAVRARAAPIPARRYVRGSPNRARSVRPNTSSARGLKRPAGEKPSSHAITTEARTSATVIAVFCHAPSHHWPLHASCHAFEKGQRYGIGHWSPSGPRAPIRSPTRCRWKLTSATAAATHRRVERQKAAIPTPSPNPRLCAST